MAEWTDLRHVTIEYLNDAWELFYIMDLDTRKILKRCDSKEDACDALSYYNEKYPNIELVQAMHWDIK